MAAVLPDDPVAGRQTQTRSAPLSLRGKERLEQMCLYCCVHTGACVTDREQHIVTGGHAGLPTCVGMIQLDVRRFDYKLSTVWHGVACVDGHVDDHLLNLHS